MLDVISPCVTFNDHEGSTKSYAYVKDHDDPLEEVSFVPFFEDIAVDYEPGSTQEVTMHDGSKLYLKKLEEDYDPTDKINALKRLHETARRGEFATGIIYIEPDRDDFLTQLNVVDEPLATLPLDRVRPGPEALEEIMEARSQRRPRRNLTSDPWIEIRETRQRRPMPARRSCFPISRPTQSSGSRRQKRNDRRP